MGNGYPTDGICGLGGKTCAFEGLPPCDPRTMMKVRPLTEDPPADEGEHQVWVDAWVGRADRLDGGICKLPGGRLGIYFGRKEDRKPASPVAQPAPPPQIIDDTPEADSDSSSGFMGILQEYWIYAGIGAGVVALGLGAYALFRGIRGKGKAGPPLMIERSAEERLWIRGIAERLQVMLAVHEKLGALKWYRELPVERQYQAMRAYSKADAMLVGARPLDPEGIMVRYKLVGDKQLITVQEVGGASVEIRPGELANSDKAQTLAMQYDALLEQIKKIKAMGSRKADLSRVNEVSLARTLLVEMHVRQMDGSWGEVEGRFASGSSELTGPVPPDWIVDKVKEEGLGVDGQGDPFSMTPSTRDLAPEGARSIEPHAEPMLGEDLAATNVGFSTLWNQLITTDEFRELVPEDRQAVLKRQATIEDALHHFFEDESFRRRYVDENTKRIDPRGLWAVLTVTLAEDGVEMGYARGLDAARAVDIRRREGSWVERLRERLRGGR